ncbi:MAG TPA: endolytic transglycosylase MltG [Terriglobales bacterium]|nr:endolytic transglycosylase MltG [Terriglobales bacterium]
MRVVFTLFLLAVLAGGGWLAWVLMQPVTPAGQTFVLLHPGYSTRRIATELQSAGVIRNADAFVLWQYLHHKHSLKAGEYLFDESATSVDIHRRLVRGDVYFHTVVIPEGYNMFDIAQAIQNAGLGTSEDFLKVATSDTALISDLAPNAKTLEGYLFPNTYEFTRMQTMEEMAAAMVRQFRQVAKEIGLTQDARIADVQSTDVQIADVPHNDVQQTVTLASIIEKETAAPEERPLVASVYYNRMAKHGALQADPSVIYAELLQGTYSGALHHADMQFNSDYNTYTHPGLPPGPIGNPGKTSLEAAMHPADTDYFYFVSNGNGHHRFAKNLEEHNKNVAAYRKAMNGK